MLASSSVTATFPASPVSLIAPVYAEFFRWISKEEIPSTTIVPYEHLAEIDQNSRRRMEQIICQMAQTEGVDEILKAKDQMTWVGRMNNIRQRAEEIILAELICE